MLTAEPLPGWVRTVRVLWLVLVILAGGYTWRQMEHARLDTDLLALIPGEHDALIGRAMSSGRRDVLFWLHGAASARDSLAEQDLAQTLLTSELRRSGLFTVVNEQAALLGRMQRFRWQMLSTSDRALLRAGDDAALAQQGLERIASPMPSGQLIAIEDDPLGTFERALLERLRALADTVPAATSSTGGHILRARLTGDAFDTAFQASAENELQHVIDSVQRAHPGVRVECTGLVRHAAANATAAQIGTTRVGTLSTVLVLGMALWAFRRARPALLVFVPVFAGTALGYGAGFALFDRLHVLTLVFGATLVGGASDYAFHFLCARVPNADDARRAPTAASDDGLSRELMGPLFWSAGTAAIGYACMSATGVSALAQVAVVGGVGLVAAAVSILLWFPLLCRGLPAMRVRLPTVFVRLREVTPRVGLTCTILVGLVAMAALLKFGHLGNDLRVLDGSPPALRMETMRVTRAASGIEPALFVLVQGSDAQALLQREGRLRTQLDAAVRAHELEGYLGVSDFVADAQQQRDDFALLLRLWRRGGAAEQLLGGMGADTWVRRWRAGAPAAAVPGWSPEGLARELDGLWLGGEASGGVASAVRLRGVHALPALRARIAGVFSMGVDAHRGELIDVPVRLASSFALLAERAAMALIAALVLIGIGLVVWWRKPGAARGMLPVTVSLAAALGGASAFVGHVDLFQLLGAFLVLALATDFVILTLSDDDERTVIGMLLGALATGGSFFCMVLLPIPAVQGLGLVVAAGTLLALLLTTALRRWIRIPLDGSLPTAGTL